MTLFLLGNAKCRLYYKESVGIVLAFLEVLEVEEERNYLEEILI